VGHSLSEDLLEVEPRVPATAHRPNKDAPRVKQDCFDACVPHVHVLPLNVPQRRVGSQSGRAGARWHDHLVLHDCAMAILRDGDTVLMCHRHPDREWVPNVWDFPGGHVEDHETPQQALARELEEELGVTIDAPSRPADEVLSFEDESVRLSVWFIDYGGPIENRCPEEHDDVRWVSLDVATELGLADAEYIPLLHRALRA
jgi:mutator protein MutT